MPLSHGLARINRPFKWSYKFESLSVVKVGGEGRDVATPLVGVREYPSLGPAERRGQLGDAQAGKGESWPD